MHDCEVDFRLRRMRSAGPTVTNSWVLVLGSRRDPWRTLHCHSCGRESNDFHACLGVDRHDEWDDGLTGHGLHEPDALHCDSAVHQYKDHIKLGVKYRPQFDSCVVKQGGEATIHLPWTNPEEPHRSETSAEASLSWRDDAILLVSCRIASMNGAFVTENHWEGKGEQRDAGLRV